MITPKFNQFLFRSKFDFVTIRIWITDTSDVTGRDQTEHLVQKMVSLREKMEKLERQIPERVILLIREHFEPGDRIARYEVVSNANHCGFVEYIE